MAELAAGAVRSLLLVIRSEWLLLGRVQGDVQFIREEMESMNSFLGHLARSVPPGGEHDEQVRTWMNQVRFLAQDCNNCIDLYLYRGNPDVQRARGRIRRYLWWAYWFLHKLKAQHDAAIQLRELKERARHVGERRLRYGVEVPNKSAAGAAGRSSLTQPLAAAWGDDDDDGDDQYYMLPMVPTRRHSAGPRAYFVPPTLEEYVITKLFQWRDSFRPGSVETMSTVIMAPDTDPDALALARENMVFSPGKKLSRGYGRGVLVDISAVHAPFLPLRPKEVLYYVLRQLKLQQGTDQREGKEEDAHSLKLIRDKMRIYWEKKLEFLEIREKIKEMMVYEKLDAIKTDIQDRRKEGKRLLQKELEQKDDDELGLEALLHLLFLSVISKQDQSKNEQALDDKSIDTIAEKLKERMEADEKGMQLKEEGGGGQGEEDEKQQSDPIRLHQAQYKRILQKVFPEITCSMPQQDQEQGKSASKQATKRTVGEDQFKQMISKKMDKMRKEFKEQLKIKWLVDKIRCYLKNQCPLFILKAGKMMDASRWEDTRNSFSLLELSADVLIVTTIKDTQQAKDFCYPPQEPIDYSLVGLYHDTVLGLSSHLKSEQNYDPQIFRDILNECEPHEFCMKLFTHALYANPRKSNEEFIKLNEILHDSPKSFDIIAKKMFKFSYSDLPKEYKSCLLYLAIFPPGHNIKRSILIVRWVAEGLIFKEDWPSSVSQANRCFDMLINRWLVYPADIGATGKVKSCVVGHTVHGFITNIAKKQHIVDPRLSRRLARHFSIFNELHLRSSEGIPNFLQRLSKSSRISLLKVLDLECCQCFAGKNQRYLKVICRKMLLLKYLCLRGTDITQLPREINHLRDLEMLDIRQTEVPVDAIRHVLLLKLKRLLAGHIDSSLSNPDNRTSIGAKKSVSTVWIPHKIGKMENLEVLNNVKAQNSHDLKDLRKLCYLRKLGVVIDDNNNRLKELLQAISDLHECLLSLSITASKEGTHSRGLHECLCSITARQEGTPSSEELPADIDSHLKDHPNNLESLSIKGNAHLLSLFAKPINQKLAKVTLSTTSLNEGNLEVLNSLPNLRCVKLREISCTGRALIFKEDTFKYLKYLLIEGSNLTDIKFESGAASELEKMVLSSTEIESVSGVKDLKKLEELELNNNNNGRLLSSFDHAEQITKWTLRSTLLKLKQGDLQILTKKPNMRYLVLLYKSCEVSQIAFNKDEFPKLNILAVDCSGMTEISFMGGSAPKLEKIVWSSSTSLSGINNLPRLKELEVIGVDVAHNEVEKDIKKHNNEPHFKHTKPDQAVADAISLKSLCWKNQV